MGDEDTRTIEINGVKCEVDMRTVRKVESYRVGHRVKVLVKGYSGYSVHVGAIVSIDPFKERPTINVAYVENTLSSVGDLKFVAINSDTEGVELCPIDGEDVLPNRETVLAYFNKALERKQLEMQEIEQRKDYFMRLYGATIADVPVEAD